MKLFFLFFFLVTSAWAQSPFAVCSNTNKEIKVLLYQGSADVFSASAGIGKASLQVDGKELATFNATILTQDDPDGYPHIIINEIDLDFFLSDEDATYTAIRYEKQTHKVICSFDVY